MLQGGSWVHPEMLLGPEEMLGCPIMCLGALEILGCSVEVPGCSREVLGCPWRCFLALR